MAAGRDDSVVARRRLPAQWPPLRSDVAEFCSSLTTGKCAYLLIQILVLLLVPISFVAVSPPGRHIPNFWTQVLIHMGGMSGLYVAALPAEVLSLVLPETLSSIVVILVYISIATAIYSWVYLPDAIRIAVVSFINLFLAIWSLCFGELFLGMSMQ